MSSSDNKQPETSPPKASPPGEGEGLGSEISPKEIPTSEGPPVPTNVNNPNNVPAVDGGIGARLRKNPRMTALGKQNLISTLKKQISSLSARLNRQLSLLEPLLSSSNLSAVNHETLNLDRIHSEIVDVHARLCETLSTDDDRDEYQTAAVEMEVIDGVYFDMKTRICAWQMQWEERASRKDDGAASVSSHSSSRSSKRSGKSNKSGSSKCSTSSNKSLKLRAKIAGLRAESEAIKRTSEAELNVRLLKNEEEIAKMEAMEKVYAESSVSSQHASIKASKESRPPGKVSEDVCLKELKIEPKITRDQRETDERMQRWLNSLKQDGRRVPEKDGPPHKRAKHSDQDEPGLHEAVATMVKLQAAPKPDLDVFKGDPLEYPYFKASFREVVETAVTDQPGRLTRLIKYTTGDAKELIKHLIHADPNNCYTKAVQMLDKEYGNPHLIHQSYIRELRQWESIKPNDTAGYKKLYRFLLKCETYKDSYGLKELDSTEMIRGVISKVHQPLQDRWNRKATNTRKNESREADFSDLIKFIEYEVTLMSDPAYSRDALSEGNKLVKSNFASSAVTAGAVKCALCLGQHDIEFCEEYTSMDIDERHKTVFQKKLCFGCLDPVSESHNAKSCENKRKCMVCKENHPTSLHGGKAVSSFFSSKQCSVVSMCVVQVDLWHKDNPDLVVRVYALLDECSTGSFITDNVLDRLNVPNLKHTSVGVTTLNGQQQQPAREAKGLIVQAGPCHSALYNDPPVRLPPVYSRSFLAVDPEEIPTPSKIRPWSHLESLVKKIPNYDPTIPIGLMIGGDCPKANEVREVIPSVNDGPYGKRTSLGWCVIGPIAGIKDSKVIHSNYTSLRGRIPVKDVTTGKVAHHSFFNRDCSEDPYTGLLNRMYLEDFNEVHGEKEGLSVEDRRFLQTMEKGVTMKNGHYQLPIPLRDHNVRFPNNRFQAISRLDSLKRRMIADPEFHESYNQVIEGMLTSGYARVANTQADTNGKVWYVPHFGVINEKKGKLRVVLDFSATFKGRCLNKELIPGPNLANLMIGVIIRFRKEHIAYMADIEAMYHQVLVPEDQRCLLRFLYWPEGDLDAQPVDLEMCVHPFGAVSSGNCANFALHRTADDNEMKFGPEAANSLRRDFYVDDHLKSNRTVLEAATVFEATRRMCEAGGFKLTKFVSNSPELTETVPSELRAPPPMVDLNMSKQQLPLERPLGVFWCIENDTLQFRIVMQDKPMTRRGVLATIGSVHDPTGVAGPFLLPGRKVLQLITKETGDWDDELPQHLRSAWEKWRLEIPQLEKIKINRCYKPPGFDAVSSSLHSFSDASDYGYGMVTYLRQVDRDGRVCVALVMAKSRVVPSKTTTIPRMELTAAVVSAKVTALVKEELDMALDSVSYWVDSTISLGYIQNETKRARTFVANRQQTILSLSNKEDWNKVDTKENPADSASRGLMVCEEEKVRTWLHGPQFLWEQDDPANKPRHTVEIPDDDPEIQAAITCNAVTISKISTLPFLETCSSWMEAKETLAQAIVFIALIRKQRDDPELRVDDLHRAEVAIIEMLQDKHYLAEKENLRAKLKIARTSTIVKLDPFLDEKNLLRVGGRLRKGKMTDNEKHPIILPKKEVIVEMLIQHHHEEIAHLGRTSTLGEVRNRGYWIINGGSQVRKLVNNCRHCKGLRGKPETQKMADLPEERVSCPEPPFTHCGTDMFGPFIVKEGRKELKRYGAIFTCFSCRGIHIETTKAMTTDSFILALRRFLGRRGPVRSIRSDNGGNYVGAEEEMKKALQEMDHSRIRAFLLGHSCDWIEWRKNPPESSHMGGIWERLIRTVRNVLSGLMLEHSGKMDDESFRTLLIEVEAIVNSRPLSTEGLNDENESLLTPNHLLTMKSKVLLPPPGNFQRADVYCRKRWRAVQHLANVFWQRFRKEYINVCQPRQKWNTVRRNVAVGDVVLVVEKDAPRNRWLKGRVVKAHPSEDGLVRHVDVKVAGSGSVLKRPITKLIILLQADDEPSTADS